MTIRELYERAEKYGFLDATLYVSSEQEGEYDVVNNSALISSYQMGDTHFENIALLSK